MMQLSGGCGGGVLNRRGGRGSHYLPPRDTPRRAELGLPATRGCVTRLSCCKHLTGSNWTGKPTSLCSSSPTLRRPRTARCRSCMALTAVAPPESETGRHLGNFPQAFFCAVIG